MKLLIKIPSLALLTTLVFLSPIYSQDTDHKCGTPDPERLHDVHDAFWGYSYPDLESDLDVWGQSEFVTTQTIGQSTNGRNIYELTITEENETIDKRRVYIHARTHPGEVQSFWVTNEMIKELLSDSEIADLIRKHCIFHVVPMYNPDGVMLEYPRENANQIDIESNWNKSVLEVEVVALKNRFKELMNESNPIEVALNMHSAYACKRYFVYHHENGTSNEFAELERDFIGGVRQYFETGMEPYFYYISWRSSTPTQYPESWWWMNYGSNVMALTYEDMNCSAAGSYDLTAFALLSGIYDYLDIEIAEPEEPEVILSTLPKDMEVTAYPNPFVNDITVSWQGQLKVTDAYLTDMQGKLIMGTSIEQGRNTLTVSGPTLASGNYIINLKTDSRTHYIRISKS